ncbi:LrgB family protein [Pseudaeromonas sharmana]|uniref:LrgB family protein n=1 Tax=Pseudaeromonas sharmana TaxID=328412 RepID=A0ABV8CPH1_9GAMM
MIFYFAIPLTLLLYWLTRQLYRFKPWPFINPVLLPMFVIMAVIVLSGSALQDYQAGAHPIHLLLEPAVVALAIPLYQQIGQIRARLKPILLGCSLSVLISVGLTLITCSLVPTAPEIVSSIATRSITTPLAMSVSSSLGGVAAIAAAIVVLVGILGAVIGFPLLRLFRVTDPQAQGLAIGACSHAVGTAAAAERGTTQGAFSSLAMVVCGVLTAILAPVLFALYHWISQHL